MKGVLTMGGINHELPHPKVSRSPWGEAREEPELRHAETAAVRAGRLPDRMTADEVHAATGGPAAASRDRRAGQRSLSIVSTSRTAIPGSVTECPASPTTWSREAGQAS